ncbi:unnamed protein product [Hydatigera taeniaeformis]|uniref:Optic atrophy 3 protein homolog n=1 Tax=Hydatigena taeniaeformis TaxID=6205 RepID=A0A0R3X2D7_HYDTA|nr:unnamed protein product [Hydatigera taeniaeformis]
MVGPFPIFKLGILAVKQISRPVANRLKQKASCNGFFRKYLCIPSGQLYHVWNTRLKLKLLGLGKPKDVKRLPDESAAEVGAEILGECIMFSIGAFLLFLEYRRQSKNEVEKERKARSELESLQIAVQDLESRVAFQSEALYQFSRRLEKIE